MSNVIRVGDRTTVGGVVLDGAGSISTDGRSLSFNGARVSCPKCGSMGIARSLTHHTNVVMNGRQLLQAGDQCICKCPPRALVASQGIASLNPGGGVQPYQYAPVPVSGDAEELAGSTNEKYARKMYGYDNSTFREMIHLFKKTNGIGPNDDLEFEDNGDVYFNGDYIDNFHTYGN